MAWGKIILELKHKLFSLDRSAADKLKYNKIGGGGIFIMVKRDLNIESKLESISCDLPIVSKICLSTFYRYGYSSTDTFEEANKYFHKLAEKFKKIILIGDLNLSTVNNCITPKSSCQLESSYIDLFQDLGLYPLIHEPTHKEGNILDQLFTNQPGFISKISVESGVLCNSVILIITFELKKNVPRKKLIKSKIFNFKKADWIGLNDDLSNVDWRNLFRNNDIYNAWNVFKSKHRYFAKKARSNV